MSNQLDSISLNTLNKDEKELKQLIEEKDRLTFKGKYLEAEIIKNQIVKYKEQIMNQKIMTLREYQQTEMQELEDQYISELKTLTEFWDEKIIPYESNARQIEEETPSQHEKNIESLVSILNSSYKSMKYTKEYLECKTMEMNLAKNEKYKEAHYYKLKCERIEKDIIEKYHKDKEEYIKNQVAIYEVKLDNDYKNLQEKCRINLNLLKVQKEKEVSKLNKKFNNRRNELNDIHMLQNKISQNENHLRAKVTSNRITTLMRSTTAKMQKDIHTNTIGNTQSNNLRKSENTTKYPQNNTQQSQSDTNLGGGNYRKLTIMEESSNEFSLNCKGMKIRENNDNNKEEHGNTNKDNNDNITNKNNGYFNAYIDSNNS